MEKAATAHCTKVQTFPIRQKLRIGRNINQIAKRLNADGFVYDADIQEIKERLDEIWQLQRRILLNQP